MANAVSSISGEVLTVDGGVWSALNVSSQRVIKVGPSRLMAAILQVVGGTATTFNDVATTGAVAAANQIISVPSTAAVGTVLLLDWPCTAGIVITPGTSAVWAVSYI